MASEKINSISVRMYTMGTGDCFVLKFFADDAEKYTMMIDCGSCQGGPKEFRPYLENLATYVNNKIDLLVVTHEHNDHVNGFAKCPDIFRNIEIKKAWMAWTENPDDPDGKADDLLHKRKTMREALELSMNELNAKKAEIGNSLNGDYFQAAALNSHVSLMDGLNTLAEINLPAAGSAKEPLAGMKVIKEILEEQGVKIKYLKPGETISIGALPDLKFYILGPPYESEYVYKHEKEGVDVYKRKLSLAGSMVTANAFLNLSEQKARDKDIPFSGEYLLDTSKTSLVSSIASQKQQSNLRSSNVKDAYDSTEDSWRKIDNDWLNGAGTLALRLNTHINNTSVVMAIESVSSKKVVLLPGDAEYGSWESWHAIEKWNEKGRNKKHLVEDLLNRTVFYKISHHLSFNGTPTKLGIDMMEDSDLTAMATLDRNRISSRWKGTMPNANLIRDFMQKCQGRLIIMDEHEIKNAPSDEFDFDSLGEQYVVGYADEEQTDVLYKEFVVDLEPR